LKQQLWLGIAGTVALAAGGMLGFLQPRELTVTHRSPSVSTSKPTVGDPARLFPIPEASRPYAAAGPLSARPAPSHPQPVASIPTPGILVAPPIPNVTAAVPDLLQGSHRVYVEPPWLNERDLWSSLVHVELGAANNGGGKVDFLNKQANVDSFQPLDVSNMSNIGAAYRLITNDDTMFRGRLAGGISRDYAGLGDGQQIPEVLLGFQVEHQISHRNKILGGVEYARDIMEFGRYRVRTQAAWEVLLATDKNVSLRTGIMETSNKSPGGEPAKNLDCNLDVIWRF
jgi:hypothetical protein